MIILHDVITHFICDSPRLRVADGPVDFSSRPTSSSQLSGKTAAHSESEEDEIDIVGEQHGNQPMLV